MLRRDKANKTAPVEEKVLNVDASMQGTLSFNDPVNLHINGKFEGTLNTKGDLTIGSNAVVKANIKGETIVIAGTVSGEVIAEKSLKIVSPANVTGNIRTPSLVIEKGATINGNCQMNSASSSKTQAALLSIDEVARYLEVDKNTILQWASNGRIPAERSGSQWFFNKAKVDEWVSHEKVADTE